MATVTHSVDRLRTVVAELERLLHVYWDKLESEPDHPKIKQREKRFFQTLKQYEEAYDQLRLLEAA